MAKSESSSLHIYNSLSRKKELFEPIKPPFVGLYVCGPTVYGDPHLGHARAAITFDVIYRYLQYLGYKVRYVRNITDVGHLEHEEEEHGEDKILKKARIEQVEPMEIVQRYTISYHKGMDALNCLRPDIEPTATGHIIEQIELVKKILENGFAYEVDGNVYFDLEKYRENNSYGELSGKVLEDLQAGSRDTEGMDEKKNPYDFALWKKASTGHIMRWDSPWGEGFPGWHMECTTMSTKYLGKKFDIHGGGLDLQFPHHEAEIAQCKSAYGNDPVKYWVHNNMITIDGAKMSKSAGNFINLEELFTGNHDKLEKAFNPMTVRFLMLQSHYRSKIDFSNEALVAAEKGLQKLMTAVDLLDMIELPDGSPENEASEDREILDACKQCQDSMNDDFNTAQVLAALFDLASKINAIHNKQLDAGKVSKSAFEKMKNTMNDFVFDILGLQPISESKDGKTEELVNLLIDIRSEARENKDFATSDKIRDDLQEIGIRLKDDKDGKTTFEIDG
ncbi:cysteine--tRNA ligase [Rhodohalobacter sulfatireducens]|uniref:Cysteine--tRNA ligase n=1 Tax=Rhodohalobacter sulfatireducens TaxID=2911366 RepID=A0ABS9KBM0_9BACT|nr:cysteine--tRNA ligase [Rhodohalobacter sulfatireducens]MCG2588259.1 cysteine--tRNA ligase [Rhodohalobacter sulfatireducens]